MMVCSSPSTESSTPNMVVAPTPIPGNDPDPELHTFREAIALSGKNYFNIINISKKYKLKKILESLCII